MRFLYPPSRGHTLVSSWYSQLLLWCLTMGGFPGSLCRDLLSYPLLPLELGELESDGGMAAASVNANRISWILLWRGRQEGRPWWLPSKDMWEDQVTPHRTAELWEWLSSGSATHVHVVPPGCVGTVLWAWGKGQISVAGAGIAPEGIGISVFIRPPKTRVLMWQMVSH